MEEKTNMRYVDTTTASVKMTGGIPFTGSSMSGSSIEDEFENDDLKPSRPTADPSPKTRTPPSQKLVTSVSNSHRNGNNNDSLVNSDLKENSPEQTEHLPRKNVNGQQMEVTLHNNNSLNVSETPTPPRFKLHTDKESNSEYSKPMDEVMNESMPCDTSSSVKYMDFNSHVSDNGASLHDLYQEPTISQTFADSKNKISCTNSGRSMANLQHSGHMPANNVNMKSTQVITKDRLSSLRTDNLSSFNTKQSSASSREQCQSERLSQSLENSQESVLRQWKDGMITSNSMSAIPNAGSTQKPRLNPFNDIMIDEDHFSDTCENYFRTDRRSTASTKSSSVSHSTDWWQEQSEVSFAELGLSEDHFSHPQGHFGLSRAEELELAIENCKELIRDSVAGSDKQKNLVLKLVQLRIKLQEVKEGPEPVPDNVKVILSHKMMLKNSRTSKYYCERCNGAIWGMLQVWYRCTECGYRCHEKCLQQILRTCAKAKVLENPTLVTDICPKEANSLAGQNYRCWECRLAISFKGGNSEPRLCDYMGRYYCEFCHWNDVFVIPARVLHSWDFIPRKVSRSSKQFLKLMQKKAVIRIQDINPMLFVYVDQLNEIKKLREEIMLMKKYILSCPNAMSAKLLLHLEKRQHFVECSDRYSMQDLLDAENALLPELASVHRAWGQHIKGDCQLCQGRGFCCEICGDKEVLFPFDSTAVVCAKCATVLHRHCFAKANLCPRCERRGKRKSNGT